MCLILFRLILDPFEITGLMRWFAMVSSVGRRILFRGSQSQEESPAWPNALLDGFISVFVDAVGIARIHNSFGKDAIKQSESATYCLTRLHRTARGGH